MAARALRVPRTLVAPLLAALTVPTAAAAAPAPGPAPAADSAPAPAQTDADSDSAPDTPAEPPPRPPRIDGPYVGGMIFAGTTLTRVNNLDDGAFASFGGGIRFGEIILPWLGLGLAVGGAGGIRPGSVPQRLGQGQFSVDVTFVPAAKRRLPLTLRTGFGFGGGAVLQTGSPRSGFGGALFNGAIGYTFFPWAKTKRPYKGGGFGIGPELGWIGFTPAAKGRPMSNTIYASLTMTFFFGS